MRNNILTIFILMLFMLVTNNSFAQPQQSCVRPPSGMVAWFPFDENAGTTTANLIAGGNAGTLTNGPNWVAGSKVANSLNFDGSNDFVQVADYPQLNFGTGDFSIDAWIRMTPGNAGGVRMVVDKRVNSGGSLQGYLLFVGSGNGIGLQIASGGNHTNYPSQSRPAISDGNWHHIAVTVDRDGGPTGITFYFDGAFAGNQNPSAITGSVSNSNPLRIGSELGTSNFFNGGIDEVELFDRVLTPEEVRSIFLADKFGKCKRTCCGEGDNFVNNGNFNAGNSGFETKYSNQFTNFLPGNYWVGNSAWANQQCKNWSVNGHTNCNDPNDNFLIINGWTNNSSAPSLVWSQNVNVPFSKKEETYYFCSWFKDLKQCCFNKQPNITLQTKAGSSVKNQNATISTGAGACDWQLVSSEIIVPPGTSTVNLSILLDGTVIGDGNDLAVDDISLTKKPNLPTGETQFLFGQATYTDATHYTVTATPGKPQKPDCKYIWTVVELDASNNPILSTKRTWTIPPANTGTFVFGGFPGASGSSPGVFEVGKTYEFSYRAECDCSNPQTTPQRYWIGFPSNNRMSPKNGTPVPKNLIRISEVKSDKNSN